MSTPPLLNLRFHRLNLEQLEDRNAPNDLLSCAAAFEAGPHFDLDGLSSPQATTERTGFRLDTIEAEPSLFERESFLSLDTFPSAESAAHEANAARRALGVASSNHWDIATSTANFADAGFSSTAFLSSTFDASGASLPQPVATSNGPAIQYSTTADPLVSGGFTLGSPTIAIPRPSVAPTASLSPSIVGEVEPETPNSPPVAVNDTVTTNEDTPVSIAVLANDSDTDGDPVNIWLPSAATTNGSLDYNGNEVLYTPNPDFNGTEAFQYIVEDGAGGTATGNVTITVNPVNDAPSAFNDAYSWQVTYPVLLPLQIMASQGVLANDMDYDNGLGSPTGGLTSYLDSAPPAAEGAVSFATDGSFTFTPASGFYGVTQFTYHVQDSGGLSSNGATVKLIVAPMGVPGMAQAADDAYPVGQIPISISAGAGVLANDTDGAFAVLRTHPSGGRIASFALDGSFGFAPSANFFSTYGSAFTYSMFTEDGWQAIANVRPFVVGMQIYNGQSGTPANDWKGAYTVANLNDTDGDGTTDKDDNAVKIGPGSPPGSSNEIDLMRLDVRVGRGLPTNTVRLSFARPSPEVRLWAQATKEVPVPLTDFDQGLVSERFVEFTVGEMTEVPGAAGGRMKTFWIEAIEPSTNLRDIHIKVEYLGVSYSTMATALWVASPPLGGNFRNTGTELSPHADGAGIRKTFTNELSGRLGLVGVATGSPMTTNNMEMEFTVGPSGIGREAGIKFDITRNKEGKIWGTIGNTRALVEGSAIPFNSFLDNPNDDKESADEDNEPTNDHIYSVDGPGFDNNAAGADRAEWRANFMEYVRVKINDLANQGLFEDKNGTNAMPAVQGTRASIRVEWLARLDLERDGNSNWARRNTPGENEIVLGRRALENA